MAKIIVFSVLSELVPSKLYYRIFAVFFYIENYKKPELFDIHLVKGAAFTSV